MNTYAEVKDGIIVNITSSSLDQTPLPTQGGKIIDVTRDKVSIGQVKNIKTLAIIKDGKVINITDWHRETNPIIPGHEIIELTGEEVYVGWNYADGKFTAPVIEEPPEVTEKPFDKKEYEEKIGQLTIENDQLKKQLAEAKAI